MGRICSLQLGNVVGDLAGMVGPEFLVAAGQETLQRRLVVAYPVLRVRK